MLIVLNLTYNKHKFYKTWEYWSEKGLGVVSLQHFVYKFSRTNFKRANSVIWLSLLFETLGNRCIATVYFPVCDVINSEINPSF